MLGFSLTKRLPTGGSCISNTLRTLTTGRVTRVAPQKDFFNRKRELSNFKEAFSATPELHVVLGPPSTGKTALIREVTSKGDFNPLFIDCRRGQFDSPETVYNSISMQFKSFFEEQRTHLKEMEINAKFPYIFDFKFKLLEKDEIITPNNVIKLLYEIDYALPDWDFWNGYNIPPPILIIDEANLLSQLGESSKEGAILLKTFLNWLVANTKQEKRFHAVLTSSDSFFFNWIANLLHVPHATPYVVGDLSKEEAEEYFEKQILPKYECKELEGRFDHVRKMTGTRMLIIERYVKEYKIYRGKFKDNKFSIYKSEYLKLMQGLYTHTLRYPDKTEPPFWTRNDLIKTMGAIVEAKDQGYILQNDLIEEIGQEQVKSLINYNFLHCRPTTQFANDIIDPPEKIILTAMNQPSVRAMEEILSEVTLKKK